MLDDAHDADWHELRMVELSGELRATVRILLLRLNLSRLLYSLPSVFSATNKPPTPTAYS